MNYAKEYKRALQLAQELANTPLARGKDVQELTAILLAGQSLNIDLATALNCLFVDQHGCVGATAVLMRSLAEKAGYVVDVNVSGQPKTEQVNIKITKDGREMSWTVTMNDIELAGLSWQSKWKTQRVASLVAYATGQAIRTHVPGVMVALGYAPEELGGDKFRVNKNSNGNGNTTYSNGNKVSSNNGSEQGSNFISNTKVFEIQPEDTFSVSSGTEKPGTEKPAETHEQPTEQSEDPQHPDTACKTEPAPIKTSQTGSTSVPINERIMARRKAALERGMKRNTVSSVDSGGESGGESKAEIPAQVKQECSQEVQVTDTRSNPSIGTETPARPPITPERRAELLYGKGSRGTKVVGRHAS